MKTAIVGLFSGVFGEMIGAFAQIYISTRELPDNIWTLSSTGGDSPVFVIDTDKHSFYVCYQSGDGDFIYFDNSNRFEAFPVYSGDPSVYPRIKKNECEIVAPEEGAPNIGFFLDTRNNASKAEATWRLIQ